MLILRKMHFISLKYIFQIYIYIYITAHIHNFILKFFKVILVLSQVAVQAPLLEALYLAPTNMNFLEIISYL